MKELLIQKLADPKFYLENLCKIKSKQGGLIPFKLNNAQLDLFNTLRKSNRVQILKARQIGYCCHPSQRILTSDLRWIPIDEVEVGQEIVATEEYSKLQYTGRKLIPAVVEAKWDVYEPAYRLRMDNGEELIATAGHRFLCHKFDRSTDTAWRAVRDLKIGMGIRFVTHPWGEADYEDGWFSGMMDGEGYLAKPSRSGTQITVSQVDGPVFERLEKYVKENGVFYRIEIDRRQAGTSSKLGSKEVKKIVVSRTEDVLHVVGRCRPSRFLSRRFWENKNLPASGNSWPKVVAIEALPVQRMIDLQTSEKTFIVEGFVSHNSTAVTGYLYHKAITNPGINVALIGYNSDLTKELLDKVKTFYRTTPDELKPTIAYNSKFEITFPKVDSKIIVLPSSENVGRGYTLHAVLCVSGDTIVYCGDGEEKRVKDVLAGDFVVDGTGNFSRVQGVVKKEPQERMFRIICWRGLESLSVTENHEVLVSSDENDKPILKKAIDLTEDDYLAFPIRKFGDSIKEFRIPELKRLTRGGSTFFPEIKSIPISKDLGMVVGWYLAEGWSGKNKVIFGVNPDKAKQLIPLLERTLVGLFKGKIDVKQREGSRSVTITIYSRALMEFFQAIVPGKAWEKTIPDLFWECGKEFNQGLLEGYILGDGSVKRDQEIRIVTTSSRLANQIRMLCASLRIGFPSLRRSKSNRYEVKTRDRYDLILSGGANIRAREMFGFPAYLPGNNGFNSSRFGIDRFSKEGADHYWVKIKSIEEVMMEEQVYDLLLEGEPHTFLTKGGICKNCTEYAFWDKAEEKMAAIEAAVPANGIIVIETTPNGVSNAFYRMWMQDNGYTKKEYGWWWHYTPEEIDMIRRRMDPRTFAQEYELAFLSSGRSVFDKESLEKHKANILKVGDEATSADGEKNIVTQDAEGLRMYFPPKLDHLYVVGVDTSEGVEGGDFSVAVFWDRMSGEEVAIYRGLVTPDRLALLLNQWGRFYNNALMVVEVNNHGLTTLTELKKMLYPSLYFRPSKFETIATPWSEKLGWKTTVVTRPLLIDDFAQAVRDNSIKIHSKELVDEMTTFVYDNSGKMTAAHGFKDDCVFAAAIGVQGFKAMYDKPLVQLDYQQHLPTSFSY